MVSWQYLAISPIFWFKINLKPTSLRRWRLMMKEFQLHRPHSTKLIDSTLKKMEGPQKKTIILQLTSNHLSFCKCLKLKHQVVQDCGPSTIRRSWSLDFCWELCWYGLDFHNHRRKRRFETWVILPYKIIIFGTCWDYFASEYCCGFFPPRKMILFKRWSKDSKAPRQAAIEHRSDGICQGNSFLFTNGGKELKKTILELGYLPLNSVKLTLTPCKLHSWVDTMPKANRFCKLPKT